MDDSAENYLAGSLSRKYQHFLYKKSPSVLSILLTIFARMSSTADDNFKIFIVWSKIIEIQFFVPIVRFSMKSALKWAQTSLVF